MNRRGAETQRRRGPGILEVGTEGMLTDDVGVRVRLLLARVLEQDAGEMERLPDSTPLFGSGMSLDSLTGLELLEGVRREFGVDIASEDLNLDSLQTVGTLAGYVAAHGQR